MHEGHRERVREKYRISGLDSFADHEILELLLFYANRRGDTNATAHKLLDTFGSISAVFEAPYDELIRTDGIGDIAATLITLVPQLFRRYTQDKSEKSDSPDSFQAIKSHVISKYYGLRNECPGIVTLDVQHRITNFAFVAEGSLNFSQIDVRKIAETALRNNAYSIIITHNHPGGVAAPSRTDIEATRRIIDTLKPLDIKVSDHIIISDFDVFAMSSNENTAYLFI